MSQIMPYILLLMTALAGGVIGYLLWQNGWRRAYGAVMLGHVFAAIALFVSLRTPGQPDAVMHGVFLIMFVLPSLVGMAVGGGAAAWRARQQGDGAP
jgi:hypothetical protein